MVSHFDGDDLIVFYQQLDGDAVGKIAARR
jgi:hypothetical protein